jgi:hypothetical protein
MTRAEGAEAPESVFERLTNLPWDKALAEQLAADINKAVPGLGLDENEPAFAAVAVMVIHIWDMALWLVDECDDPTRLVELLRGPARLFPWLSRWLMDLLSRRVAEGSDEETRQALVGDFRGNGEPTMVMREAFAMLLEKGALRRRRGRQPMPSRELKRVEDRFQDAVRQVKMLRRSARASGDRLGLEDAIDEAALDHGLARSTLKLYIQGKHGGVRRHRAKLLREGGRETDHQANPGCADASRTAKAQP